MVTPTNIIVHAIRDSRFINMIYNRIYHTTMRERRFIGNYTIAGDTLTIDNRDIVHQISHVLRLAPSHEIVISDGKTQEITATILAITKKM